MSQEVLERGNVGIGLVPIAHNDRQARIAVEVDVDNVMSAKQVLGSSSRMFAHRALGDSLGRLVTL